MLSAKPRNAFGAASHFGQPNVREDEFLFCHTASYGTESFPEFQIQLTVHLVDTSHCFNRLSVAVKQMHSVMSTEDKTRFLDRRQQKLFDGRLVC